MTIKWITRSKLFFIQLAVLVSLFLSLTAMGTEINLSRSQLTELAQQIKSRDGNKSSQIQYDFIRIALIEMIVAYEHEIGKSLQYKQTSNKKKAKTRRWQLATQAYLDALNENLIRMDSGTSLDFLISKQNKIMLLIGAKPVIVSGPNAGSDTLIEKKIVTQFCLENNCSHYFKTTNKTKNSISKETSGDYHAANKLVLADVSGTWNVRSSLRAEYVSSNGLTFKFSNVKERADKQDWVYRVLAELHLLQQQLSIVKEKGHPIHWQHLSLTALPETDNASQIRLNKQGDFIKVYVPELTKNQQLFKQLIPWIEQQFAQKSDFSININHAEQFFHQSLN